MIITWNAYCFHDFFVCCINKVHDGFLILFLDDITLKSVLFVKKKLKKRITYEDNIPSLHNALNKDKSFLVH